MVPLSVNVLVPILVKLPGPLSTPSYSVDAVAPRLKLIAADAVFCRLILPVPDWTSKPPKVKALLVSALEKVRVPPAIVTVPVA